MPQPALHGSNRAQLALLPAPVKGEAEKSGRTHDCAMLTCAVGGDRHRTRFGRWVALAIVLHCGVRYFIHSIFPFRTILAIIPPVLIECVFLFMLMLKLTGQSDAESG